MNNQTPKIEASSEMKVEPGAEQHLKALISKPRRYWTITVDDLTAEAVEMQVSHIIDDLTELAKKEGEEFLTREWHDPKPKTWQEAYVRIYAIEFENWQDYENRTSEAEIPPFMWETWQEQHIEELAHQKLASAISKLEIEITL